MKRKPGLALALFALVMIAAAAWYLTRREEGSAMQPSPSLSALHSGPASSDPSPGEAPLGSAVPSVPTAPLVAFTKDPVLARIEQLFARLQRGDATGPDLAALRTALLIGDPARSSAAISAFLATGSDAPTGQEFAVGEGGTLAGAATLRVFLMDVLGEISRQTGGDAAAKIARQVLETKTSADEWAVSLRNVAWHEPGAKAYLANRMREMLAYEPWRTAPSGGMLEAFDVVVFAQDTTFIPTLAGFLSGAPSPLQQASAVALDRLSEAAPLAAMTWLNSHPAELADRPFLRADFYAKADLRQLAQRQALEFYLGRQDVTAVEKTKLLKALAVPGTFLSDNLLTSPAPPDDDAVRQAALSKTLADWQAAGRFPELHPQMQQVQSRLGR